MYVRKRLSGKIGYNGDDKVSKFDAYLEMKGRRKNMTIEDLAKLLITYEGYEFEIKILEGPYGIVPQ